MTLLHIIQIATAAHVRPTQSSNMAPLGFTLVRMENTHSGLSARPLGMPWLSLARLRTRLPLHSLMRSSANTFPTARAWVRTPAVELIAAERLGGKQKRRRRICWQALSMNLSTDLVTGGGMVSRTPESCVGIRYLPLFK